MQTHCTTQHLTKRTTSCTHVLRLLKTHLPRVLCAHIPVQQQLVKERCLCHIHQVHQGPVGIPHRQECKLIGVMCTYPSCWTSESVAASPVHHSTHSINRWDLHIEVVKCRMGYIWASKQHMHALTGCRCTPGGLPHDWAGRTHRYAAEHGQVASLPIIEKQPSIIKCKPCARYDMLPSVSAS